MVSTVDTLYVDFAVHELFACCVEVLGGKANAWVAWIDLDPLKVMSKQSFPAEVCGGEIGLPTPAHLVDRE